MKPRLILHIGHSKCGSTGIQRSVHLNQKALAGQGVYLFGRELECSRDTRTAGAPNHIFRWPELRDQAFARMRDAAAQADPADTFILSAEMFAQQRMPGPLSQLRDVFDVRVVHYIRNQADWCYSAWKQWQVKRGVTLDKWIRRCGKTLQPDYWATYQAYLEAGFPDEHYHMRALDRSILVGGDLIADFCDVAGIDAEGFDRAEGAVNPAMDHAMLDVLRSSDFLFESSHDNAVYHWLLKNAPEALTQRKGGLDASQYAAIMAAHAPNNTKIRNRFFADQTEKFDAAFAPERVREGVREPKSEVARLRSEVEDVRRALGYVIGILMTAGDGGRTNAAFRQRFNSLDQASASFSSEPEDEPAPEDL